MAYNSWLIPGGSQPASSYASGSTGSLSEGKYVLPIREMIPLIFGERQVNARLWHAAVSGGYTHTLWLLGEGGDEGIDEIGDLLINDQSAATYWGAQVYVERYYGTQAQTACSFPGFTDALTGIAYLYIRFANGIDIQGIPSVRTVIRALKLYDPVSGETAYSNNPALARYFLMSWQYGGRLHSDNINAASVSDAAGYCDALLGDPAQKRYEFNYIFYNRVSLSEAFEVVDRHFLGGSWLDGDQYRIDYARPKDSVATFEDGETAGFQVLPQESHEIINLVTGVYTDPVLWEDVEADDVEDPALGANDPIYEASYDLTGFQKKSQAQRCMVYFFNSQFNPGYIYFEANNDKGLQLADVLTLTKARHGIDAQDYQVTQIQTGKGLARVHARRYDAAWYSDALVTEPTYEETSLPLPTDTPTDAADLLLEEVLEQLPDTTWLNSIMITFGFSAFPYIGGYEISVKQGSGNYVPVKTLTKNDNQFELRAIQPGVEYTVKVVTLSIYKQRSAGITEVITPTGKTARPTWKEGATLNGVEAGDIVWLWWWMSADRTAPAIDTDAIFYRLYRGLPDQSLDEMTLIQRSPMLSYQDTNPPTGDIAYRIVAGDPQRETETSLYKEVTVTKNAYRAVAADHYPTFTGGALTNVALMQDGTLVPVDASYDTLGERFPGTNLGDGVGGTYDYFPLPAPATAEAISAVKDMGAILEGTFSLVDDVTKIGTGTASVAKKLLLSVDDVDYDEYDASSPFSAKARYYKIKYTFSSSSLDTTNVVEPGYHVNVEMKPKKESGVATVGSGGSLAITFEETFVSVDEWPQPSVDYEGDAYDPRTCVWENPSETGGTLRVFGGGAPRGGTVRWNVGGR